MRRSAHLCQQVREVAALLPRRQRASSFFFFFVHGSPPVKPKPVSTQQALFNSYKLPPAQRYTNLSGAASRLLASVVAFRPLAWLCRTSARQAPDRYTHKTRCQRNEKIFSATAALPTKQIRQLQGKASSFNDPPHVHELASPIGCLSWGQSLPGSLSKACAQDYCRASH